MRFNGNAQNYFLGIDDGDDTFQLGLGFVPGTTPAIVIDSNQNVQIRQDLEIEGDLNHDGNNIGFYGTAPVNQAAAYTRNATVVEDRTLLASASATIINNNNVLAALIADLQTYGLLQ